MDMRDSRNLTIGILLSLGSVLLTCTLYLGYRLLMMEGMNRDMNMEYSFLQKKKQGEKSLLKQFRYINLQVLCNRH